LFEWKLPGTYEIQWEIPNQNIETKDVTFRKDGRKKYLHLFFDSVANDA
jgi:hypothetical protein